MWVCIIVCWSKHYSISENAIQFVLKEMGGDLPAVIWWKCTHWLKSVRPRWSLFQLEFFYQCVKSGQVRVRISLVNNLFFKNLFYLFFCDPSQRKSLSADDLFQVNIFTGIESYVTFSLHNLTEGYFFSWFEIIVCCYVVDFTDTDSIFRSFKA